MHELSPIIFDIGLHKGDDTAFYLKKGFDVVAVEADPKHAAHCRGRFADEIATGRLEIVHAAIADRAGTIEFYVNLEKDDWSSTDPRYGARHGTRHEKIQVACETFESIYHRIVQHGVAGKGPSRVHYVKTDIEGGDIHVLSDLLKLDPLIRPRYFSAEAHKADYFALLRAADYRSFKLVNQNLNWKQKCPNPPKEGAFVEHAFGPDSSGPFGEEAPGEWIDFEACVDIYLATKRVAVQYPSITQAWHDVHAMLATT